MSVDTALAAGAIMAAEQVLRVLRTILLAVVEAVTLERMPFGVLQSGVSNGRLTASPHSMTTHYTS